MCTRAHGEALHACGDAVDTSRGDEALQVFGRALDVLFVLHADHELNAGTNAMRAIGSAETDPYSSLAGAAAALYGLSADVFLAQAGQGAARFSPLRNTGRRKYVDPQAPDGSVTLGGVTYGVATVDDLSLRGDVSEPGSFSKVQQDLKEHLDQHPEDRDRLQIRPQHELASV